MGRPGWQLRIRTRGAAADGGDDDDEVVLIVKNGVHGFVFLIDVPV